MCHVLAILSCKKWVVAGRRIREEDEYEHASVLHVADFDSVATS